MKIETLNKFGGEKKEFQIGDFAGVSSIDQLPKNMQIRYEDVNPEANLAEFICHSVENGIDMTIISERSGFSKDDIEQLVREAKSSGIYEDLVSSFLK